MKIYNLLLLLLISLLSTCTSDEAQFIVIDFESDVNAAIRNQNFTLSIYGYDRTIVDQTANLISQQSFEASTLSFRQIVGVPDDADDQIDPVSDPKNIQYYITLEWDSDNNGTICEGDISIDYNRKFPNISLKTLEPQKIYLNLIPSSTACP